MSGDIFDIPVAIYASGNDTSILDECVNKRNKNTNKDKWSIVAPENVFGLPVLEAMRAGAPVITSRDPALTEVTAGAAVYVDAASQTELNAAVLQVIRDPDLQHRLREKGRRRACQFSWRSTASLTRAVYADAIRSI